VNVLVLTDLFPDPRRPRHGLFVQRFLQALEDTAGWKPKLLVPRPVPFPVLGMLGAPPLDSGLLPPPRLKIDGRWVEYPRYPHLRGVGVPLQAFWVARAAWRTYREYCSKERYKAVFGIYLYPYGVAAARLAGRLGLPLILSGRGTDVLVLAKKPFLSGQVRKALRKASFLHAVSQELAREMEEVGELPGGTVTVVENGVDPKLFKPGLGTGYRKKWGIPGSATLVLNVGRLDPVKGQDLLVEALSLLDKTFHLVIVGEGPYREHLESLAEKKGLADRVHLVGPLSPRELSLCYRDADIFALPSRREGCPNALLEALASGVPCVARAVGAVPSILEEGRLGTLVTEDGPEALAAALARTMGKVFPLHESGDFGRKRSWETMAGRFAHRAERALGWR